MHGPGVQLARIRSSEFSASLALSHLNRPCDDVKLKLPVTACSIQGGIRQPALIPSVGFASCSRGMLLLAASRARKSVHVRMRERTFWCSVSEARYRLSIATPHASLNPSVGRHRTCVPHISCNVKEAVLLFDIWKLVGTQVLQPPWERGPAVYEDHHGILVSAVIPAYISATSEVPVSPLSISPSLFTAALAVGKRQYRRDRAGFRGGRLPAAEAGDRLPQEVQHR